MKKEMNKYFIIIVMILIGVSCNNGIDVEYVDLEINNSTSDELYVKCNIDYTSWHVVKDGDKNNDTVTIPSNSSRTMTLAYNFDTTDGFFVRVAKSGTDNWFSYHYKNSLTSSYYNITVRKTKDPDNLYKISVY